MAKTIKTTNEKFKKKYKKDDRRNRRQAIACKRSGIVNIWR